MLLDMTQATMRLRSILPKGTTLTEGAFWSRHRAILLVLGGHLPLLAVVGLVHGSSPETVVRDVAPVAVLVAIAAAPLGRLWRMLAATLALVASSAVLVHLTGGMIEAHFHFFLTLGLIALYQDWRSYLLAIGGVIAHHGVIGVLAPQSVYNHASALSSPWAWAFVHGFFVLAVSMTHLAFWKLSEAEQDVSRDLWRQLYEGERALVERLQAAEAVKTELLSVVSHEFRTPLTAIIGFSHTLMARSDQLDPATVRLCVRNIDQQSRRLARLVHNVLAASGDVAVDPTAVTDLAITVASVSREIADAYDADLPPIAVDAPPVLRARIDGEAAHRVLLNLVDNAVKFGVPGTAVTVRLRAEGDRAVITVANVASPIAAAQIDRIFLPFVQQDSSDSRAVDGIGLGLHVVRRLLEAYEGSIAVHNDGDRVVFTASLPLGGHIPAGIRLAEDVVGITAPLARPLRGAP
jgi:signal transduction histidine kinase